MKPLFNVLTAVVMVGCLAAPALNASATSDQVYTWVDKNGVRHYSDHPRNPKAQNADIHPNQTDDKSSNTAVPAAASENAPAKASPAASATKPKMTPEQRAARCATLKDQVERLKSARRVKVNKDGESRFVSGDDLVELRAKLHKEMRKMCAPPAASS